MYKFSGKDTHETIWGVFDLCEIF